MTTTLDDVTPRKKKAELTKVVLETALNEEMTEHLGYAKHDPAGAGRKPPVPSTPASSA